MKKAIGVALLVLAPLAMTAGNALAGENQQQGNTDPPQTQLRERTSTQTCDHNQEPDGAMLQVQDRTRHKYPNADSWVEFWRWLLGME